MGRSADVPRAAGEHGGDDSGCTILHVDMDAFFASVEIRRRPELRNRPVVVGGGHRGVVAAASYEARRYGVRSAMPMSQALRLCPRAVVLPPDRAAYAEASAAVMAVLHDVTPLVEPLSLDEAFLDVSGALRLHGRPAVIAAGIRRRIHDEQGLTCSVGVAPTKFAAKLASARCKPDGLLVVPADRVLDFLHPLPVTVIWGVGARTGETLHRLGVRTVADLAATPFDTLRRAVGTASAQHLSELAQGRDPRGVRPDEVEKSISSDRTLDVDLTAEEDVLREVLRLSADVGRRVRDRGWAARTIGIKIRFADFRTVTRVRTLETWTDETATIHEVASQLYRGLGLDRPRVRLVGVKAEGLRSRADVPEQLTLDAVVPDARPERPAPGGGAPIPAAPVGGQPAAGGPADPERSPAAAGAVAGSVAGSASRATDRVLDAARARFGVDAIRYGSLLSGPSAQAGAASPSRPRPRPPRGSAVDTVPPSPQEAPQQPSRAPSRERVQPAPGQTDRPAR